MVGQTTNSAPEREITAEMRQRLRSDPRLKYPEHVIKNMTYAQVIDALRPYYPEYGDAPPLQPELDGDWDEQCEPPEEQGDDIDDAVESDDVEGDDTASPDDTGDDPYPDLTPKVREAFWEACRATRAAEGDIARVRTLQEGARRIAALEGAGGPGIDALSEAAIGIAAKTNTPVNVFHRAIERGVEEAINRGGNPPKAPAGGPRVETAYTRPVIQCTGGTLHENATEAEAALIASGTPFYTRGQRIVMPIVEEVDAARGGTTKVARVKEVSADCITDHLSRKAEFMHLDKSGKKFTRCNPPPNVAKTILSRDGEWKFKPLTGVITTPTLRRDGSILAAAGYDPDTKLLLMDPPAMPAIPDNPSRADAEAALELLNGLLTGFPFVSEESRSVALSGLITPVVRGAMTVAPLHAITAPSAGTVKSYLVELFYAIATGQRPPALAAGRTEEETEKRLASAVAAARPLIAIDNLNGELGGDLLCQLVERPIVSVRILGFTKLVDMECQATVFANGNNITPQGDVVRRTILCTLDADEERPELRTFAGDPLALVMADRGKYIAAAITIVRAFIAAGRPIMPPPLASYNEWSLMVRAPLIWLGCEDPVKTQEKARENDP